MIKIEKIIELKLDKDWIKHKDDGVAVIYHPDHIWFNPTPSFMTHYRHGHAYFVLDIPEELREILEQKNKE